VATTAATATTEAVRTIAFVEELRPNFAIAVSALAVVGLGKPGGV